MSISVPVSSIVTVSTSGVATIVGLYDAENKSIESLQIQGCDGLWSRVIGKPSSRLHFGSTTTTPSCEPLTGNVEIVSAFSDVQKRENLQCIKVGQMTLIGEEPQTTKTSGFRAHVDNANNKMIGFRVVEWYYVHCYHGYARILFCIGQTANLLLGSDLWNHYLLF